jgi:excisionase family DNA binding protein
MPANPGKRKQSSVVPILRIPEVLDVQTTAQFLTVSTDTVYSLFQKGTLPGHKVGRKWLTTKTVVLRWLEQAMEASTLTRAIENGDSHALMAAVHAGKARTRSGRV